MQPHDRKAYVERYESRLRQFGHSPETLGWGKTGRQEFRFAILADAAIATPGSSVLDVGCGFADLYDYLVAGGWSGRYVGVDLVPGLVDMARQRHPDLDVRTADIAELANSEERFDYVIASGIFNARLASEQNGNHIERTMGQMFGLCTRAMCVDFMSTYVDFQHETAWHTDPAWAIAVAHRLSGRYSLRHDYMPYEFALTVYKDARISERNVFAEFDPGTPVRPPKDR
jgi:SAM-dependent methyltransferase